ncbi:hypothetical protein BOX15_Mlig029806g3 [Macrostomum lignano]|uniref:Uncharacterized protein n=1 Tax=Macrostomum lignano TaxID=282301 RepID=A0A267FRK1_9PLAT|nr:hypothetical protein BOX15_Mlig029806g3 [Macrostomum lignano]
MRCLARLLCLFVFLSASCAVDSSSDAPSSEYADMFNLAIGKFIESNATCGEGLPGGEPYCHLANHVRGASVSETHCKMCLEDEHQAYKALDRDSNDNATWWQSPSLARGSKYHYVTLTLDLKQVYRVSYIIIKSAYSPLPGNWILERSLDGSTFSPWMYFVLNEKYCREAYGMEHVDQQTHRFAEDDEVICTSAYDKAIDGKIETAELAIRLSKNRPGSVQKPNEDRAAFVARSKRLAKFTIARYIRFRFQKIATFYGDRMIAATGEDYGKQEADTTTLNRLYYSIKDIKVGGSCVCFGHARECPWDKDERKVKCNCDHNTEGDSCERCKPLFNQLQWQAGKPCVRCQCHGKADSCVFNQTVANQAGSVDIDGKRFGGGVCQSCRANTTGANCELCLPGFYRVAPPGSDRPCAPCRCDDQTTEQCHQETVPERNITAGDCKCRAGFTGPNCASCAFGYQRVQGRCVPCQCSVAGSKPGSEYSCTPPCQCKANVEPLSNCDVCKSGFFNLQAGNALGCSPCFCFGAGLGCSSARGIITLWSSSRDWTIVTNDGRSYAPRIDEYPVLDSYSVKRNLPSLAEDQPLYWRAPPGYLSNLHTAYGGEIVLIISFEDASDSIIWLERLPLMRILADLPGTGPASLSFYLDLRSVLKPKGWPVILRLPLRATRDQSGPAPEDGHWINERQFKATEEELRSRLVTARGIEVLAKYSLRQRSADLRQLGIPVLLADPAAREQTRVENCTCQAAGYSGLSCEACQPGYRRVFNRLMGGDCAKCDCNGQSDVCDANTGACVNCTGNTEGDHCERCRPGYYGNPKAGVPCRRCACPSSERQFSSRCQLRPGSARDYICENCAEGHTGAHCEQCRVGYYGNPRAGQGCKPCNCSNNSQPGVVDTCDTVSGRCKACSFNTEGERCETCQDGFYGTAANRGCRPCDCLPDGSEGGSCHAETGQCRCKPNFTGQKCDSCLPGRGNLTAGCPPCRCNSDGSISSDCSRTTGECACLPGVAGPHCKACQPKHFDMKPGLGCFKCNCGVNNSLPCDPISGECRCGPRQQGRNCTCKAGHYWNANRTDCLPCNCNAVGSDNSQCDILSGQCFCKPGVGGRACDTCLDNFWGFGESGCEACSVCYDGQRCDKLTGLCNCPPNTFGRKCEFCEAGHWNYSSSTGCKPCRCHSDGSLTSQCNLDTGNCSCRQGFAGDRCDRCDAGFHSFPRCQRCHCNWDGVLESKRNVCRSDGSCFCKPAVTGRDCLDCVSGTFARLVGYSRGCIGCYCSGTGAACRSDLGWYSAVALTNDMQLTVDESAPSGEYGVPANSMANFHVIRGSVGYLDIPLRQFVTQVNGSDTKLGDLLHEYGSKLAEIQVDCVPSCGRLSSRARLESLGFGPEKLELVSDDTIGRLVSNASFRVVMTEDHWRFANGKRLSRDWLMHFLRSVVGIRIYLFNTTETRVNTASVDFKIFANKRIPTGDPVETVERCECPHPYVGLSCQDYGPGYYRNGTGIAVNISISGNYSNLLPPRESLLPCPCHGHSKQCNSNGSICFNCANNTIGSLCDKCLPGHYRPNADDLSSPCLPCACPSVAHNYADNCVSVSSSTLFCLDCRNNTGGSRCEKCANHFYGDPRSGVPCRPCRCSPDGIQPGSVCDSVTGQCKCLPSIQGRTCDTCKQNHVVREGRCVSCNDTCTGTLIDRVNRLKDGLGDVRKVATNLSLAQLGRIEQLDRQLNETETAIRLLEPGGFEKLQAEVEGLASRCLSELGLVAPIKSDVNALEKAANNQLNASRGLLSELGPAGTEATNLKRSIQTYIRRLPSAIVLRDAGQQSADIEARVTSAWQNRLKPYISSVRSQLGNNASTQQLERLRSILASLNATVSMNAPFLRAYLNGIIALSQAALAERTQIDNRLNSNLRSIETLRELFKINQKDLDDAKKLANIIRDRLNSSDAKLNEMNVAALRDLEARLQAAQYMLNNRSRSGAALPRPS